MHVKGEGWAGGGEGEGEVWKILGKEEWGPDYGGIEQPSQQHVLIRPKSTITYRAYVGYIWDYGILSGTNRHILGSVQKHNLHIGNV